jgi:membrane protease YdiL (CAAX protease family)
MELNDNTVRSRSLRSMGLYLVVAFVMAWALWLVGWLITQHKLSLPLFPVLVVGSFGPFVGAVVVSWKEGGPRNALRFLARAFDWRMGWAVFLVSFFLLPILAVIVELVHAKFTQAAPQFTMTLSEAPLSYLFLFLIGGTLAEEYGWSLLSDKLDGILPLKTATFVLGVIWALWHVPLFFIVTPGAIQGYTPFYIFLTATVAMRFLFAWAYHRGGNSVLSNMLFHTASNMAYSIVALAPSPDDLSTGRLWMFAVLNIISAAVLWGVAPPVRLGTDFERRVTTSTMRKHER